MGNQVVQHYTQLFNMSPLVYLCLLAAGVALSSAQVGLQSAASNLKPVPIRPCRQYGDKPRFQQLYVNGYKKCVAYYQRNGGCYGSCKSTQSVNLLQYSTKCLCCQGTRRLHRSWA